MAHDRLDGDELMLTHEFLALMLGVRRPGVTVALHLLEGKGLIRSLRGVVQVQDREGLEEAADGAYGVSRSRIHAPLRSQPKGAVNVNRAPSASSARSVPPS